MSAATFEVVAGRGPLRVLQVGAGAMGRAWLGACVANPDVDLVGLVDLDVGLAARAAVDVGLTDLTVGTDLVDVARRTGAQAVIDVTAPAAHHGVTTTALFAGLPVLGEKPAAETVAQALSLRAAAEVTGQLFVVSQSRRYDRHLTQLRAQGQALGALGALTTQFFRAPRFGGFRDQMAHPLLLDMAIHPFDIARWLLAAEPVAVYCEEFNPPWSWYAHDACATAVFEMSTGARYIYAGSWCSPGLETSWNGQWRLTGARGSATWDGDGPPRTELVGGSPHDDEPVRSSPDGIAGALADFVTALRGGVAPMGEIGDNLLSLAMVEAAALSSTTGQRVRVDAVIATARDRALADESRDDVRAVLRR